MGNKKANIYECADTSFLEIQLIFHTDQFLHLYEILDNTLVLPAVKCPVSFA